MRSVNQSMANGRRILPDRQKDHSRMRQLFFLVYPLCVLQALVQRGAGLLAGRPRASRSVLAEARSAADAAVGYAFHV